LIRLFAGRYNAAMSPDSDPPAPGSGADPTTGEQAAFLAEAAAASPEPAVLKRFLQRYAERNGLPAGKPHLSALALVAGKSPFLGDLLLRNPEYLPWAVAQIGRGERRTAEDLREDLARFRFTLSTLPDAAALRRFKHREYLRIALRDFTGQADLPEVTRELSLLADTLLDEALGIAFRELRNRFGPPQFTDEAGRIAEATLAILSLGKLGGEELNYSSDIDLIFFYSREGQTAGIDGREDSVITNREFFTRLAGGVVDRIAGISAEGQVFRVDLGLRPGGKDGEIVSSLRGMLAYYRSWARTWERQSMLKARHSAGDPDLTRRLLDRLAESIYAAAEGPIVALEIKEMKDRIDLELTRSGRSERDLKLGRGGIRELEFAVQALQIGRGARDPWLREGNTLRALHRLADKELVSFSEHFALSRAYVYLRRVEHALQIERNLQNSLLPDTPEGLRALARRLGWLEPPDETRGFLQELEGHRATVRAFYDRVFGSLAQARLGETEPDPLLDPMKDPEARALLRRAGIAAPEEVLAPVKRIRRLLAPDRVGPEDRKRTRRLSPTILREAASAPEPARAFLNLERFLSTLLLDVRASSAFFERAEWIPPLLRLFGRSESLSRILSSRPEILEELGSAPEFFRGGGAASENGLRERMDRASDLRTASSELRRHFQAQILLTGFRDVHRQENLGRTLVALTELAETCLRAADRSAVRRSGAGSAESGFCILALGRLGYRELDYNSDLDLVFLGDPGARGAGGMEPLRRRAESVIHLLTAATREGSLYSVDMRLRPGGREGELVQTPERCLEYFRSGARTWEKMAYLKARPVAGDRELGQRVIDSIRPHLYDIPPDRLAGEVRAMKQELDRAAEGGEGIPLKTGPGGILDIHFLIEYLQIRDRVDGPVERDTLRMLSHLHDRGLLPDPEYPRLYAGYLLFRSLDHAMRLLFDRTGDRIPTVPAVLDRLATEVGQSIQPETPAGGVRLLELLAETREAVRAAFLRIVV
jgi:glutamate-ammonia-ligase adenylyltransferase